MATILEFYEPEGRTGTKMTVLARSRSSFQSPGAFLRAKSMAPPFLLFFARPVASHTSTSLSLDHGRCLASGSSHTTGFDTPVVRRGSNSLGPLSTHLPASGTLALSCPFPPTHARVCVSLQINCASWSSSLTTNEESFSI